MTTQPASINFKMYTGATFEEVVTLTDSAGDPLDLTGKEATCHIRREKEDAVPVFSLTSTPAAGLTVGGVLGTVTLSLTAVQTGTVLVDIDGETWVYDLLLDDGTTVERAYQGYIFVFTGVTR